LRNALAIVSDVHLGAVPALDDFVLDERFGTLLAVLDASGRRWRCHAASKPSATSGWKLLAGSRAQHGHAGCRGSHCACGRRHSHPRYPPLRLR
jgi:hypothetical protein